MKSFLEKLSVGTFLAMLLLAMPFAAKGQAQPSKYPNMAPIEQYFMSRDAEIALAESAAPQSISQNATILIMGRNGYGTAVKGKNGFTCLVQRSWTAGTDDPEFWNPKVRAPICYNREAARSYLARPVKMTELALAGRSKSEIAAAITTALEKKELPSIKPGSMCYMLSKQGYLNDRAGHWHPHLMFFFPEETEAAAWGANQPGSPILGDTDKDEQFTVFLIPVGRWSDGSAAPSMQASESVSGQK